MLVRSSGDGGLGRGEGKGRGEGGGGRQRKGVRHWASALFGIGKTEGEKGYLRGVILALAFALQALALALDCV